MHPAAEDQIHPLHKPGTILPSKRENETPQIWWANGTFFVFVHIAACIGLYYYPPWVTKKATLVLWFAKWQLADFGITIGYHRLYSHKAFRASFGVRVILAILGSAAFQGSIKVGGRCHRTPLVLISFVLVDSGGTLHCSGACFNNCLPIIMTHRTLRHRLHHVRHVFCHFSLHILIQRVTFFQRFTDDPIHDPYAATRGMFYSHMGWIFFKPIYERMDLIERDDLENDPVWHCTFLVNSLAHWDGLQPYSDEDTSRGNLIVALLTGGEGNHNFHAFPHDFRSGPSIADWDPSKWIIICLHRLGLVTGLRRAHSEDIDDALRYMKQKEGGKLEPEHDTWDGKSWNMQQILEFASENTGRCIVLIDGYAVDVTSYFGEHPGGAGLLRRYGVSSKKGMETWLEADWAFNGGLNNHSRAARKKMMKLRVASVSQMTRFTTREFSFSYKALTNTNCFLVFYNNSYAATRGMFYAHMGWIFFQPTYERMDLIERDDLKSDPIVRFQHKYYVPLALFFGLVAPTLLGMLWGDALGAYIWGGLISRVCIWHFTFLVNSLAHWDGLQPYSDEDTSRGNLIVAFLTGGEGNHNFHVCYQHAFPHDFRSGPSVFDWDPNKWIIICLYRLGLATGLRRAHSEDIDDALRYMKKKEAGKLEPEYDAWDGKSWNTQQVLEFASENPGRCIVLIDGYAVDVTSYFGEHPGGAGLLRRYGYSFTLSVAPVKASVIIKPIPNTPAPKALTPQIDRPPVIWLKLEQAAGPRIRFCESRKMHCVDRRVCQRCDILFRRTYMSFRGDECCTYRRVCNAWRCGLLRRYGVSSKKETETWIKADFAFSMGLNNHSRAARKMMMKLRVAKYMDKIEYWARTQDQTKLEMINASQTRDCPINARVHCPLK
ncbi:hypothetical protein CVT24_001271 [Panaeolus cyanescens]|uniref:Cytochrome b5 heme-binding domain-containing protein n=1 Tax=Panaeolus cyanescens TaxID=181874 RepID=A0A409YG03_9AGAR|nr:hypothetical protein CVT24_001271 [Panaeolus cyanescens]